MANIDTVAMRRGRSMRAKSLTLSLDKQVQDFLDARDGLRMYDALYGETSDKLLPRRLGAGKSKRV
ncbi:MAG TPA: hypothetical protein VNG52_06435 [Stellaceae bacterium]|nr:hypothetical protein [Stellaceae bacterium]